MQLISEKILDWYDRERRDLPWRENPGASADPYRVWLSEVMLQQTTVKAVIPYYLKFVRRWPNVNVLAQSEPGDVLKMWAGLGYYSRARNLHRCAVEVSENFGGTFPSKETDLIKLPGIGAYTAAAIAAIAFDEPATVVDGNIERVIARLFDIETPLPTAKAELKKIAATLTPDERAGDYAQAMMDLGATLCTPKSPSCLLCPIQSLCQGYKNGRAALLPNREPRGEKPLRKGVAFFALREDDKVLLRERPARGLLGGMMELPSTEWLEKTVTKQEIKSNFPVVGDWRQLNGVVKHTFTHFHLELLVYQTIVSTDAKLLEGAVPDKCTWVQRADLADQALPSVMRKVISHGFDGVKS